MGSIRLAMTTWKPGWQSLHEGGESTEGRRRDDVEIVKDQPHRSWSRSQFVHQRGHHVFDAVGIFDEDIERVDGRAGLQDGES